VHSLEAVDTMLPGLGTPLPLMLEEGWPAVGRSLAELNLRGVTGATVLAITRGEQGLVVPSADERLNVGDVLALAGSHEAIRNATALLRGLTEPPTPQVEVLQQRPADEP
jgi:CPA2 family monovalent cation:H+ antiporter-2